MGSALILSLRKRRIRCPTRSKHRLYLPFVRQKRRGLPKGPLHVRRGGPSAGSARRLVRPGRSALPETVPRGGVIHNSAPLSLGSARCLVRPKRPALLGKVPRGFSSIFRLLPGQEGGGQCPLPCPANLSVLLTLPCPGALPLLFHPTPGRTCP